MVTRKIKADTPVQVNSDKIGVQIKLMEPDPPELIGIRVQYDTSVYQVFDSIDDKILIMMRSLPMDEDRYNVVLMYDGTADIDDVTYYVWKIFDSDDSTGEYFGIDWYLLSTDSPDELSGGNSAFYYEGGDGFPPDLTEPVGNYRYTFGLSGNFNMLPNDLIRDVGNENGEYYGIRDDGGFEGIGGFSYFTLYYPEGQAFAMLPYGVNDGDFDGSGTYLFTKLEESTWEGKIQWHYEDAEDAFELNIWTDTDTPEVGDPVYYDPIQPDDEEWETVAEVVYDDPEPPEEYDCQLSFSVTGNGYTEYGDPMTDENNVIVNIPKYVYLKFSQDVEITEE